MTEECTHDCASCKLECDSRTKDLMEKPHELSKIKKVIAVVSGKGGVGKSLVTSMLAVSMRRNGFATAILDADVTGPSIPKSFGIRQKADGSDMGIFPVATKTGIRTISINNLLENDTDPVVWRGPMIAGAVKQFWTDVIWGDIDYMFIDMPPGTGDVPLTVFQSIPVSGIVIVTSPQELVSMIVEKAVKMASMMKVPVLGIVENMSYFECPSCKEKHFIYGKSHIDEIAKKYDIKNVAYLPIDPRLADNCDRGLIELYEGSYLDKFIQELE
jgi:Mrp family chromosome partitioning ATPase